MPHEYRFVPVSRDDYPMLRRWLAQPHMAGWWGAPEAEIALIDGDLGAGSCDMRIVWADRPFGFVQDYPVRTYGAPHYGHLPDEARALDMFLGDPAYLGAGHGAGFLKARAAALFAQGTPVLAVDPDPENHLAVATFARAGFRPLGMKAGEDGAPVLVMDMWPEGLDPGRTADEKDLI